MEAAVREAASRATGQVEGERGSTLRAALVQLESRVGTETYDPRDDNLERALSAIKTARSEGADLVLIGEMYLTGYRTDEWLPKWATKVDPPDDHVEALMKCAAENDVHVIMGAATYGRWDVYNSTLFVGPGGLLGVYRKCHVAAFPYSKGVTMERCFYSPGGELPVYETAFGRIGVHICYDIAFPEVSRVQALKGAELLVNISASAAGFEEYWEHVLFTRAVENGAWYVVCSVVGEQRGDFLFGGSRAVDPGGNVVARCKNDEEDVAYADIDLEASRRARAAMHMFSTRQPELYRAIAEPLRP